MRGGGDEVRVGHRAWMDSGRHQSGDVRDIGQQEGADLLRDLSHAFEINHPGIGGGAER